MAEDHWEVLDAALPLVGLRYGPQDTRMALVGLGGGDLLVMSPGSELEWARIAEFGTPRWLLAPNHFHSAGIGAWKERYPRVRVVAHPTAIPRLKIKVPTVEFEDVSSLAVALPTSVRLMHPPTTKQGETWLSMRVGVGCAWFVTDGLVNETKLPGLLGGLMWLIGFRARLMVNPLFKRIFLRDLAAYQAWVLGELERDAPTLFIPSHGAVIRGEDTTARRRAAVEQG